MIAQAQPLNNAERSRLAAIQADLEQHERRQALLIERDRVEAALSRYMISDRLAYSLAYGVRVVRTPTIPRPDDDDRRDS